MTIVSRLSWLPEEYSDFTPENTRLNSGSPTMMPMSLKYLRTAYPIVVEVLVLLYLEDREMLERGFETNVGERRYNEHGSYVTRTMKT